MRYFGVATLIVGLALSLSASPTPSHANDVNQCIDRCFGSYSPTNGSGSDLRNLCVARCSQSARSGPPAVQGAIAFALVNGSEAMSWGKANQAEANRSALATCSRYGPNCRVVFNYANTCAGLAVALHATHFATAAARTASQAGVQALASCKRQWGTCNLDLTACSPGR
jgi:hypothetical protein